MPRKFFGWSEEEVLGKPLDRIFTLEDQQSDIPARETRSAVANGKSPDVRWHVTKSGGRVFLDGQTIALRHADRSLQGFLKIAQNLTERKRNEERQSVLLAELQHRVRNVLAMVGAVLNRSDLSVSTKQFRDQLSARIAAMSRTQALLTRGAGLGIDLEGLIREELLAQGAGDKHFNLTGPGITLHPKAAEVLTLAVHKLATNARNSGALSQPSSSIDVQWSVRGKGEQIWLDFSWLEQGVELEPGKLQRKGFGTELITGRVPYELGGTGNITLEAGGPACRLALLRWAQVRAFSSAAFHRRSGFRERGINEKMRLDSRSVLLVDDDYILALDAGDILEEVGAKVIGPFSREDAALSSLEEERPEVAVVDLNLGSGPSFDLVRALTAQGVPTLIVTG